MTTESAAVVGERLLDAAVSTTDLIAIALGDRLGYYRCLAERDAVTSLELAEETGTVERCAREWLEQQAVSGLFDVADDGHGNPAGRRFRMAEGVSAVLADPDQLSYLAPLARQLVAAAQQVPAIAEAFRTGRGVPWARYGVDMRESEADMNRPGYLQLLATEWLGALPDVRERLLRAPAARVADVGCGGGWAAIGVARGFPLVQVDGYDLDEASVELARRNVSDAGLGDRVRVHRADIGDASTEQPYDLVMAFECLHDMPYPVQALTAMRHLVGTKGTVLLADMKVADDFTSPGDLVERLMYGFSLSICLPDSMSSPGSAATGTVIRQHTVGHYAKQAGFGTVETLDIEHDLWRFYRLG
jgi:2-polyprenyl-3-methyl-5-hydroxy-6-metoxy-1,4-benzoquinol methylase